MTPFTLISPQSSRLRETPATAPATDGPPTVAAPPAWFEALFWTTAWLVAHFIPGVLFSLWTLFSGTQPDMDAYQLHLGLCGRLLALGLAVFVLKARVGSSWKSAIHLQRPRLAHCLLGVLCLPAILIMSVALLGLMAGDGDRSPSPVLQQITGNALWFVLLVCAVAPAVNEEVFFRGFVGRVLLGRYGVVLGILFTSAIFGVGHGNMPQIVLGFIFGCFAHAIYLATRSLWVPILMHFVTNAFVQVLLHYQLHFSDVEPTDTQLMLAGLGIMLVLLVSLVSCWGLYRLRERQAVPELSA